MECHLPLPIYKDAIGEFQCVVEVGLEAQNCRLHDRFDIAWQLVFVAMPDLSRLHSLRSPVLSIQHQIFEYQATVRALGAPSKH